jgi:hypothetical protein
MTGRDVASDLPNMKEECETLHFVMPRTPPARGLAVPEFKYRFPTYLQRQGATAV